MFSIRNTILLGCSGQQRYTHKALNRVALEYCRNNLFRRSLANCCRSVETLKHTTAIAHPVTTKAKIDTGIRIFALVKILRKNSKTEYFVRQSVKV